MTASLAEIPGVTLRELFDASFEDEDFLVFVNAVANATVDARAEQVRELKKKSG